MPIDRQLPMLCLRGSIANITMANITQEEREHIDKLTRQIAEHPDMQSKRRSIIHGLGTTIGADYRDDQAVADNEYYIAIWRGLVNLFYHRKYTFACKSCQSAHYITTRNKIAAIDRQKVPCPNCSCVEIDDVGELDEDGSPISGLEKGQYITLSKFRKITANFEPGQQIPTCRSCIKYTPGEKIYEDPELILNDREQMRKFFGEYTWNYYRQQIRENQRTEHKKKPTQIIGKADEVIFKELLALCLKYKLDFHYDESPGSQHFVVGLSSLLTPPEFTADLVVLRQRALSHGITLTSSDRYISVLRSVSAIIITGTIVMPEHVMFQEETEQEGEHLIAQLSYKTVGGCRMDQDDHVAMVDTMDVLEAVRAALPDGTCQAVFDIDSQQGPTYKEFSQKYGDNTPRKCHIAEFLGIAHRTVGQYRDQIRVCCYYHNLAPVK